MGCQGPQCCGDCCSLSSAFRTRAPAGCTEANPAATQHSRMQTGVPTRPQMEKGSRRASLSKPWHVNGGGHQAVSWHPAGPVFSLSASWCQGGAKRQLLPPPHAMLTSGWAGQNWSCLQCIWKLSKTASDFLLFVQFFFFIFSNLLASFLEEKD